jgi:uncharacterized protein with HEPN domain
VSPPEPILLRRGLVATERCAARLQRSLKRLQAWFPIDGAGLQGLAAERQDDINAFLKRFEQLMLTLQDQVFVGLAIREGEDPRELSRRDLTELMERLRAIPFRTFAGIRNRLAHLYPEEPDRQAANLNAAYDAAPRLLEAARQALRNAPRGGRTRSQGGCGATQPGSIGRPNGPCAACP